MNDDLQMLYVDMDQTELNDGQLTVNYPAQARHGRTLLRDVQSIGTRLDIQPIGPVSSAPATQLDAGLKQVSVWESEFSPTGYDFYAPPVAAHQIILCRNAGHLVKHWLDGIEQQHVILPNDICIVPAYTPGYFCVDGGETDEPAPGAIHVMIAPQFMRQAVYGAASSIDRNLRLPVRLGKVDPVAAGLILAMAEYARGAHGGALDSLGAALSIHVMERYGVTERQDAPGVLSKQQLAVVSDFMQRHITETPKLEYIAAQLHMRVGLFVTLFKATTGMTPLEFYRDLRMRHARKLIETTAMSITHIAAELGFADAAHFSRAFSKHWKAPPSVWRR